MRMLYRLVSPDAVITIPPGIARCPYCKGALTARIEACTQETTGWVATEIDLDCGTEPDWETEADAWRWWMEQHTEMPYVYLLPVEVRILAWLKEHYRFLIADAPAGEGR